MNSLWVCDGQCEIWPGLHCIVLESHLYWMGLKNSDITLLAKSPGGSDILMTETWSWFDSCNLGFCCCTSRDLLRKYTYPSDLCIPRCDSKGSAAQARLGGVLG